MAKAITAFEHIQANNIKTFLLLLLFPASLIAVFYIVCLFLFGSADAETLALINQTVLAGAPVILSISAIWILITLWRGDKMILGFADAQKLNLKTKENKEIYKLVENTALMAGLPTPAVYVIDDSSLNAFATGYSPKSASIALTSGIIKKLTPAELQGVIAHELAHIGNRDIRLDMMIISGLGIFGLMAQILWRYMQMPRRNNRNGNNGDKAMVFILALAITFMIFNYILAPFIRLAISRTREFAADATGAHITHHPEALASALKKIAVDPQVEVLEKTPSMAALCIYSPLKAKQALSSTHPPVAERIKRLNIMAGKELIS